MCTENAVVTPILATSHFLALQPKPRFEDFLHRGMGQVTGPMAAPAASAPASVGTAATAAAGFLIQVPPGVVPGQTLTVKSPDGLLAEQASREP